MVAVDNSSIHRARVSIHQSYDPDPHVGIGSGEDDLLKQASGQGDDEKGVKLYLECGEHECWRQMVKRPKVS